MDIFKHIQDGVEYKVDKFHRELDSNTRLANEISELRDEISKLRRELLPVKSVILIGNDVINEFKNLRY